MLNSYAIGFACVAAAMTVGVDYVVQSKANGSYPGEYSFSAYIGGYAGRYTETIASMDKARRRAEEARSHLPEEVAGFTRQDWERDTSGDDAATAGMNLLQVRAFKDDMKVARKAAREEVYEYTRGDEVFRLSARFEPAPEDGRTERVEAFMAPGVELEEAQLSGYDIVQGVMFFRVVDAETGLGADPNGPQMLQAFLGDGVAIGVYAERPFAELPQVLAAIDYDNLNQMLDAPVADIGPDAPAVAEDDKPQLLAAAAARHMSGEAQPQARAQTAATGTVKLNGGQALAQSQSASTVSRLNVGSSASTAAAKPKRLTLSGGRTCLGQSAGKLCN